MICKSKFVLDTVDYDCYNGSHNKEARWHIGMSSASHRQDPGSNPGKGENY